MSAKQIKRFEKGDVVKFTGDIQGYPFPIGLHTNAVGKITTTYRDSGIDREKFWGCYSVFFEPEKFDEHGCDSQNVWLFAQDLELVLEGGDSGAK